MMSSVYYNFGVLNFDKNKSAFVKLQKYDFVVLF